MRDELTRQERDDAGRKAKWEGKERTIKLEDRDAMMPGKEEKWENRRKR